MWDRTRRGRNRPQRANRMVGRRAPDRPPDAGQVVPLVAIAVVVMAGAVLVVTAVGGVLADRTAARTAADAAALAAAIESDRAAADLAHLNGAELLSIRRMGDQVEVEVRVGRATARARAETVRTPVAPGPGEGRGVGAYRPGTSIP